MVYIIEQNFQDDAGCALASSFVRGLYSDKLIRVKKAPVFNDDLYLIYRKEYKNIALFKTVISGVKKRADIIINDVNSTK